MYKRLIVKDVWKDVQRMEIHNKPQLTECSWTNDNEIKRSTGETIPVLMDGSSNKQILETATISSSSWSPFRKPIVCDVF